MKDWKIYLVLAICCIAVYANSVHGVFISDDRDVIMTNPQVAFIKENWYFLPRLINAVAYKINGLNPLPYHIANILLHIINTCLVYLFLRIFFKTEAGLLAAMIFAVHPIHTEAVTWVTGKSYLIMCFFILAPYLLYRKITVKFNPLLYILSLTMFSYWIVYNPGFYFAFPLLLAWSDICFGGLRKNWRLLLPFFIIAIMRFLIGWNLIDGRYVSMLGETIQDSANTFPWRYWWVNGIYSLTFNGGMIAWPIQLTFYHEPIWITDYEAVERIGTLICFCLPFFMFLPTLRSTRIGFFLLGLYIIFLLPTLSCIPICPLAAERYLYMPSIALCMIAAILYTYAESAGYRKLWIMILGSYIVFCSIRTVIRNNDYSTVEKFWSSTVKVSPKSFRAHNNLATTYVLQKRYEEAIKEYQLALRYNPTYPIAIDNLINTYKVFSGKEVKAINYNSKTKEWIVKY